MRKKHWLSKVLSIDSGVVLAYFLGEELGSIVKSKVFTSKAKVYCNRSAVSELFYILCRRKGEAFALEATDSFLKSGYVSVISSDE